MNSIDEIKKLEATRDEIIKFVSELDEKLRNKQITGIEYHITLQEKLCGKNKEEVLNYIKQQITALQNQKQETEQTKTRNKKLITISAAAIILVLIAIIGIITTNQGSLTGYVIKPITTTQEYTRTFEHNTETQLDLQNITSLKITGTLNGTKATVRLRTDTAEYLVGEIINNVSTTTQQEYTLRTDKSIYALGETANITITPELNESEVSIYVQHNENNNIANNKTYTPNETGTYTVIAIITTQTDIIRLETNFTVQDSVPEGTTQTDNTATQTTTQNTGEPQTSFSFENICTETCDMPLTSNPTLVVELDGSSTIIITNITTTQNKENIAPTQTQNIPDITIASGEEATLNLNNYFTDPDDNTTYYDTNTVIGITSIIQQNILTISSQTPGTYQMYIYASDENELTTSNTFTINVLEAGQPVLIENQTNTTTNETNTTTNITTNETTNETNNTTENITANITINPCENPDPNLRPPECIEGSETKYFVFENVMLKGQGQQDAGRLTPLGNLIIKGQLIQNSNAQPGRDDFKVTSTNENFEEVPVMWIDSVTGDLYLKGLLYEEDFFLEPTPNAFVIQNKRNVNLAYVDRRNGDLHIKGNLIQNKENIE